MHYMKVKIGHFIHRPSIQNILTVCAPLLLAIALLVVPASAQATALKQESSIGITGSATIYGDYACKGPATVQAVRGKSLQPLPGFPEGIRHATITLAIGQLDCNDDIVMRRLRKALKEKEYPQIRFEMNSYRLERSGNKATVAGSFTIAGVTRTVEFDAKIEAIPAGGLVIAGGLDILMTDYGIKPPSILWGLIKIKDEVDVSFKLKIPHFI